MSVERITSQNEISDPSDPKMHYHALVQMNEAFLLENIFVLYRRTMIGAMTDPTAIILAVVLTALEEAILRSTVVHRDIVFRRFLSLPELNDTEILIQRKTWAASR